MFVDFLCGNLPQSFSVLFFSFGCNLFSVSGGSRMVAVVFFCFPDGFIFLFGVVLLGVGVAS